MSLSFQITISPKLGEAVFFTGTQPDMRIGEARINIKSDLEKSVNESYFANIHAELLKLENQSIYFADSETPKTLISVGSIDPVQGVPITFGKTLSKVHTTVSNTHILFVTAEGSKNFFYIAVQQDGLLGRATIIGVGTEDNIKIYKSFGEIQKELHKQVNVKTDAYSADTYEGKIEDVSNGRATVNGLVGNLKDITTIRKELLGCVNQPLFEALRDKLLLSVGKVDENMGISITYGISIRFAITSLCVVNEFYVGRQQDGKNGQIMVYGMVDRSGKEICKGIGDIRAAFLGLKREAELHDGCFGEVFLAVGVDLNDTVQITYGIPVYFNTKYSPNMFYKGFQEENEIGKAKITGKTDVTLSSNSTLKSLVLELTRVKSYSMCIYENGRHAKKLISVEEDDEAVLITYASI